MIPLPFRRLRRRANIDALYGAIVAQARRETFYRDYGVPDTVDGRLDMLMLHLWLVIGPLSQPDGTMSAFGQVLFERFCEDIDHNFREMGVGDLAVPKRMKRVASAFFGRAEAYRAALGDPEDGALAAAVARNVFGLAEPPLGARRLAAYMREASRRLGAQPPASLEGAEPDFPDPESIAI